MTEKEFKSELTHQLRRFSQEEIAEITDYYHELICDKIENEHITEAAAVASVGSVTQIASAAASEMVASGKIKDAKAGIILLTLCLSPLILPLAIGVAAIYIAIFAVYAALVISSVAGCISCAVSIFAVWLFPGETISKMFYSGCCVILLALFIIIGYYVFIWGKRLMNLITIGLAKKLMRRNSEK